MEGSEVLAPGDIASFSRQLTAWEEGLSPEELPLSDWLLSMCDEEDPAHCACHPWASDPELYKRAAEQASQQRPSRIYFSSFPSPGSCLELPLWFPSTMHCDLQAKSTLSSLSWLYHSSRKQTSPGECAKATLYTCMPYLTLYNNF